MIEVRVPATTANLGPGFDTLGLALNIYNNFTFEEIDEEIEIVGVPDKYNNKENLTYISMLKTFERLGYKSKGIRIIAKTDIPVSRGLGSSASCIVAGIAGANMIANGNLDKEDILEIATEIEGHPDNVAPAIFGGLIVSLVDGKDIIYNKFDIKAKFKFVALIPEFTLSTKEARDVLPKELDYKEAVDNVGRVSMLLSALANGRVDLLKYSLKDNLHQPYRGKLIENYFDIIKKSKEFGALGTYISGAGPTIMCLVESDDQKFGKQIKKYLDTLANKWDLIELELDSIGLKASY